MPHLEWRDPQPPQLDRAAIGMFCHADLEAAPDGTGAGKHRLHGLFEPGTGTGRTDDGEVTGAAAELPIEHEKRDTAEMIAVQVTDQHRVDLVRVELLLAHRGQAGRTAVEQHPRRIVPTVGCEGDTGLKPAA